MSNILIIKHGSLGDIAQISGVIRDIRENCNNKKIFILTTAPYVDLLSKCPYIDNVLLDKRLPRWNVLYLIKLKKMLSKYNFTHVFDLQNSSRTSFYQKYLLRESNWNSSLTTLHANERKKDFNKISVLERFQIQLERFNIKTKYTIEPDFSWAAISAEKVIKKYFKKKFILLFPFCSPQLSHKKWPFYNELINIISLNHPNFEIAVAPGPLELEESKKINSIVVTNKNTSLNIMELAGLIQKASYVIGNDTGPAHIAAHLGKMGVVLFGYHTTPKKVSIETDKFKAISVENLNLLSAENVYSKIRSQLELIN